MYWKWKTEWLNGIRMVVSVSVQLLTLAVEWLGAAVHCHCPASWKSIVPHAPRQGKDQTSEFEVQFLLNAYYFCTIVKWKKC